MSALSPNIATRLAPHALTIAIAAFVVVFSVIEPAFLTPDNLVGIFRQVAMVGIMATCMTFVIMTGGIDLSVGPVLALSGVVSFFAMEAGYPLPLVLAAGLAAGVLVGLLNGAVIAFLGLPPIIVTLAMLSIVRGSALLLGGPDLHGIRDQPGFTFIGTGSIAGIPFSIYLFVAVSLLVVFLQKMTPIGICVAAIGENERAAFLSGHRTRITKMSLYAISAFGAALAGIIQSSQVHTASATYGEFGTELDVIASVVLGGTSLMGGNGSVARTVLGVMFLGIMNNGMNILNVSIDIQLIAKGAIIALALALAERG
ncbi:ABC transporter permease [Pleomorphomonas sp. NRK KF1]|uniref:ABC transporter permease n=1 Tax=Pleomorphomonas sp. NRK KF1 TaxID=2943000 RepID=UPI0020440ED1|nr:ABC transporter permease [Pleomorphomonas sp. NRK KF1]MCM5553417.1 ABC transporter permease [Pleomorphomonas sp. NRK KF1]